MEEGSRKVRVRVRVRERSEASQSAEDEGRDQKPKHGLEKLGNVRNKVNLQKGVQPCHHLDFSQDPCWTSDPQNCKITTLRDFKSPYLW